MNHASEERPALGVPRPAAAGEFCRHQGLVARRATPSTAAASREAASRLRLALLLTAAIAALLAIAELASDLGADRVRLILATFVAGSATALAVTGTTAVRARASWAAAARAYVALLPIAVAAYELRASELGASIFTTLSVALLPLVFVSTPRRTLGVALVGASAPAALLGLAFALGDAPRPSFEALVVFVAPPYLGALMAYAGARVLSRLGGDLRAAHALERYTLLRPLGGGGMGEVFEAEHRMLARTVAIKVIRGDADALTIARFQREARVTASLESPHTIRLHDFGVTDGGQLFYVMDRLEGLDLEALVGAHGPMPASRVVHALRQVLDSLEEAHARGLVHRDIKPANLHLGQRGLVADHLTVLDFGLVASSPGARALGPVLSADGRISGTPAYLAPETLTGSQPVDGRADIYALGCVAYFLLTGRRVFDADDVLRLAVSHVTEAPQPLGPAAGDVTPELEAVVMACLSKDPAARPDAAALRRTLEALQIAPWSQDDARRWWAERAPVAPEIEAPTATLPTAGVTIAAHAAVPSAA